MTSPRIEEIPVENHEKKVEHFQPTELKKYPEKMSLQEIPFNKKMESKFREKHLDDRNEIEAARGKKSEIIEGMVLRDFSVSPEKQENNVKDFHFVDKEVFKKEMQKREPSATESDVELTKGFHAPRDNQVYVKEEGDTLVTSIHEKMHQKSKSELPTRLNEGVTEHFARQEAGGLADLKNFDIHGREIPKAQSDYEKEVEIVNKIEAVIGRNPIKRAYFDGQTDIFEMHFDSAKGQGAFRKLNEALEKRDYDAASKIITN
ncbi:MAG: hypothetical protein HQK65_17475 [Desulfamplus sp.]|nr:hypothetical protein [Desulfamplus sp.]